MHDNPIHIQIIRNFSGEASAKEREDIEEWLNLSEKNKKIYTDLQEIWLASGANENTDNYNIEKAIRQFKAQTSKHRIVNLKYRNLLKYAAIFALIIAIPMAYLINPYSFQKDTYTTISCPYGDKSEITLPDGSVVWLNSGSTLRFKNNFKDESRNVSLEGEAYFSVSKDKERPFIVQTFGITTEVLGTEFNLTAYEEDQFVAATLVEGSIKIKSASQYALLNPNQKLIYNKSEKKMIRYNLDDVTEDTEWRNGRMVFRNESLAEMELKLERWFDVDIEFGDELVKKLRFTGTLERESILETIKYFDYSKHLTYTIKGNTILFFTE